MNDLSGFDIVEFATEVSDYNNCIDISCTAGTLRFFIARVKKSDLAALVAALQKHLK